ncbi:hypothetical protein [Sediminicola luteus]|uniref:DUF3575 domain-containing protein n=1 Tax=Sediminicola luteus TaxID=319238 RepID=A0A2A4G8W7_9FLAO|nr:hypothetical protein [Sediminicola luteus]PCE64428.1 hypothetical protein B7P33_09065 [Sediminicola luteus]
MIQKLLLITACCFGLLSQAQYEKRGSNRLNIEAHQVSFDFISPGFRYEIGIVGSLSASTTLGLGNALYEEGYALGLAMNNRVRFYHNIQHRLNRGKNIGGNSGNYIAAAQAIFFSQVRLSTNIEGPDDFNLGFYGITYGIQRAYPKGFNFNVELGAGYYKGDGVDSGWGPMISIQMGWLATKQKKRKPDFDPSSLE